MLFIDDTVANRLARIRSSYLEVGEGWASKLVVQNHAEQATVDRQPIAIAVIDKAQLPELIHEMTDPRPGCANHLCQAILSDSGEHRFGSAFLAKMSKQQENPR